LPPIRGANGKRLHSIGGTTPNRLNVRVDHYRREDSGLNGQTTSGKWVRVAGPYPALLVPNPQALRDAALFGEYIGTALGMIIGASTGIMANDRVRVVEVWEADYQAEWLGHDYLVKTMNPGLKESRVCTLDSVGAEVHPA
jgi:hypothetical protein